MVRVLHVIRKMDFGGAETLIMNIYRTIDRSKIQFDFLVAGNGEYDDEIRALGGEVFYTPTRRQGIIKYRKEYKKFFEKNANKYNAVHYHCSSLSNIFPLKIAKKYGIKNRFIHSHNTFQSGIIHNILNKMNKIFISKYATKMFACSTEAGKYVFGNYNFEIVKNGIQAKKYEFNEELRLQKKEELGIDPKDFIIINVARFSEQKNHKFLLDIFYEILKMKKNSKLILIGEGPLENEIEDKIKTLSLSNKVLMLKKRKDINEILQVADVFVLPSLYEGLPLVGIEAQASGLPTVVSDTVSRELEITDLISFYSLEDLPASWANKIIQDFNTKKRRKTFQEIKESGYDIEATTNKLQNYYIE